MNRFTLRRFLAVALLSATSTFMPAQETKAPSGKVRVVLVGDSTVASKSGWGDAFGKLLGPQAECFNRALGGRSSKSFRDEGAWDKALALKPAWVLIQFGHNDQPGKGPERETDPNTTFAANLARYVDDTRAAGAQPVLITSLTRRNFENGHIVSTLTPYVEATKRVAAEKKVPLVDLHTRSIEFVEKLGPNGMAAMEPPGKTAGTMDHTHLTERGGEMTAPLVAEELRKVAPELATLLR
jgi:lysophospholipase L1-like esterase